MNNYEFYDVAINNISLFFSLLIFSFCLHYFLFRSQVKSVLDPYFLAVISSVFCLTVVYLLYYTNNISFYLFINYNLTQFAFILGLFAFRRKITFDKKDGIITEKSKYKSLVAFYFFPIKSFFTRSTSFTHTCFIVCISGFRNLTPFLSHISQTFLDKNSLL